MSGFGNFMKSIFSSPKQPVYKIYTPSQLKIIAMRARLKLQQVYKKSIQFIQAKDHILIASQKNKNMEQMYLVMMEIGQLVIEVESMRIYAEMLKKIQDGAATIISTKGQFNQLRVQMNWFRCLLWYRESKKVSLLDQVHTFCYNFFKGIDITSEINVNCEIFTIYPITRYIKTEGTVPLKILYPKIKQYLTAQIDDNVLQELFVKNKEDVKKWIEKNQIKDKEQYLSKSPVRNTVESPRKQQITNSKYHENQSQQIRPQQQTSEYQKWVQKTSKLSQNQNNSNNQNDKIDDNHHNQHQIIHHNQKSQQNEHKNEHTNPKPQNFPATSMMRKLKQSSIQKETISQRVCGKCGCCYNSPNNQQCENMVFQCANCKFLGQQIQQIKEDYQKNQLKINQLLTHQENHKIDGEIKQQTKQIIQEQNVFDIRTNNTNSPKQPNTVKQTQNLNQELVNLNLNQKQNTFTSLSILNLEQFSEPISPQNKQNKVINNKEIHEDQEQSLRFIRQSFSTRKKPLKKPYMVSIYARKEFMEKIQNKNQQ